MDFIYNFLILFSIIIISLFLHEFGHFIFAKIFGVDVIEFSIGIGFKLLSWKSNGTTYSLRILPIMAYVNLASKKSYEINREIFNSLKYDKNYNKYLVKFDFISKIKYFFKKKMSIKSLKKIIYINEYQKYRERTYRLKDSCFIEDISLWKVYLIMFGGIFFNLILFLLGYLILILLNQNLSLINLISNFFIGLWNVIIFKKNDFFYDIENKIGLIFLFNLLVINLSLFLINILPIFPLDGFKIFSITFEKITGKEFPENINLFFIIIGITFIIYLSIASVVNNFI